MFGERIFCWLFVCFLFFGGCFADKENTTTTNSETLNNGTPTSETPVGSSVAPEESLARGGDAIIEGVSTVAINEDDFEMVIPEGWDILPKEVLLDGNMLFVAQEPRALGEIETVIAIDIQNALSDTSLEQYVQKALETIRTKSQNYRKISESKKVLDGNRAYLIEYTDRGGQDLSLLRYYTLFVERDKKIFTVTAVQGDTRTNEEKKILQDIILTFLPH